MRHNIKNTKWFREVEARILVVRPQAEQLAREGLSLSDISIQLKAPMSTIARWLKLSGIKPKRKQNERQPVSEETNVQIVDLYLDGVQVVDIAKKLNVAKTYCIKLIKDNGFWVSTAQRGEWARGGVSVLTAKLCGIKPVTVCFHWNKSGAPRDPLEFLDWYKARKKDREEWLSKSEERAKAARLRAKEKRKLKQNPTGRPHGGWNVGQLKTTPQRQCGTCLYNLGFGLKAISSITGAAPTQISRWLKHLGIFKTRSWKESAHFKRSQRVGFENLPAIKSAKDRAKQNERNLDGKQLEH